MGKRIIDVLRVLAKDLIEKGYEAEDALQSISGFDLDFPMIKDELSTMERSSIIDEAELDTIRALLSFILIKDSEIDIEDIYAFVFGRGRQITWN
ncbi:MAG: hypothetical protein JXR79_00565 [Nitrospirae bacterium]|nr:hypothetical protein [Nitrospirota bacterium]